MPRLKNQPVQYAIAKSKDSYLAVSAASISYLINPHFLFVKQTGVK